MSRPMPNNVQRSLDATDRAILEHLERHGRMPNNALAEAVGIAPSTCLGRMRSLVETDVILGFHADIAPWAMGRDIQAVIAVRLQHHARGAIGSFAEGLISLPEVRNVFFVAGSYDFLVHVACPNTDALREFVAETLSTNPEVAGTETNLVFEHRRADAPPKAAARRPATKGYTRRTTTGDRPTASR
jgi:DNA-binding Lrp family transcriptional regulator